MRQLFTLLRLELANTIIEIENKSTNETITNDFNFQFTFNGFSQTALYKIHLREFYDLFREGLEQKLINSANNRDSFELLESINMHIVECEKLDCQNSIDDFNFETAFIEAMDVRLEADIKYRFIKK